MSFNTKHGLIDEPTDLGLRLDAQKCVCVCVCVGGGEHLFAKVCNAVYSPCL